MKEETERWLEKAEQDLKATELLKNKALDIAIFHSHQAVEKSLKAMQIEKLGKFDKTHDLVELSKSIKAPKSIITDCDKLKPAYFLTRYPDVEGNYSKEEANEMIKSAKGVVLWIKKEMKL